MKHYKFVNWRKIVAEKNAQIKRLNEAIDYIIERLTDEAQEHELIARQYGMQDGTEYKIANAMETEIAKSYYDAANIVKEEVMQCVL